MKRSIFQVLLVLGILSSSSFAAKKIFHWGNGAEPKDVDPHIVTGVPEHHIIVTMFEGLVNVDPKTALPIDGVAKLPPKITNKGKRYTFNLRKNAKWSDGSPVTAHDFVYAWRRLQNPKTASQYSYMLYPVKNAEKINKGKIKDLTKLGVKAINNHTLQVDLENATPYFVGMLYHYSTYPVPRKVIEKHGAKWTKPKNFVGNGPFTINTWVLNKVITTKRNPHYWDAKTVQLDEVHFHPIDDLSTEEKTFRAGKLHVTNEVPIEKIPFWQRDKRGLYQQAPYLGTYFYRLNTTRPPLNDKRVRRALALGLDRNRITKYVSRGGELPALAFTPPGTGGYKPVSYMPTDSSRLAEAKKLLAEAGFPNGKGFPKFNILYNTNEGHKKIAEAIQQMWKKNLGINVGLYNQEWKVYLTNQRKMNYDIARAGWIGDYNDPNTFLDMWLTGGGNNETGWSNKKYDALIAKAAAAPNAKVRMKAFADAEKILMDEVPVIPIYIYTSTYLKSKSVVGWHMNVMDWHPIKFVSLK